MSDCRLPRAISYTPYVAPVTITISVSGNYYSSSYGYVKINNTIYTANTSQSFTIPPDTVPVIEVFCSSNSNTRRTNCTISVNGTVVEQGTSSAGASYRFSPERDGVYYNCNIVLTRNGSTSSNRYWTAAITETQAA